VLEALPLADEDRAPADPRELEDVLREHVVARAEEADQHGGERHRHGDAERAAMCERRPLGADAPLDAAHELVARPRTCGAKLALDRAQFRLRGPTAEVRAVVLQR